MNFKKNKITKFSNYDKNWESEYIKEVNHLKLLFKPILVSIYHISSTSIPDMDTKPIIDILIVVDNINMVDF